MKISEANSSLSAVLQNSISDMRDQISDTSKEVVTGFHSDLTLHLDGKIGQAQLSKKAVDDIALDRELLTIRQTRIGIAQQQLENVADASGTLANDARVAISMESNFSLETAGQEAEASLERIFSSLSVRVGQRFLFAGDATDRPPLAEASELLEDLSQIAQTATDATDFETQLDTYFNDPAGGWQTNIYLGSENVSDPDSISATDPALTDLVRGLSVLALARPSLNTPILSTDDALIQSAADLIDEGNTELTLTRAELGRIENRITGELTDLDTEETILSAAFAELAVRDQYEAAAELQLLETNLEAAYLLTSKLANLSILNYIR